MRRRSGRTGVVVGANRVKLSTDVLPWALLSAAALVLSASAADAWRRAMPVAVLATQTAADLDAACERSTDRVCSQPPLRYTLEADSFALDSAELPADLKRPLDAVADALREHPAAAVRIEVHTDASGPADARRSLTQRRADAVKLYLVSRGLDPVTLHAVGMGSLAPRRGADPYAGSNRRIEIVPL